MDVATQAQRLLAVGIGSAQALAILIALCETQDTAVRFTRATDVGCELAQTPALIPGIAGFMAAQPAIVRRPNLTQVITDLRQRSGSTMPVLTNILVLLNPLPTVADIVQLLTRMPPRPDVPLPRLEQRLRTTLAAPLAGGLDLDLPTTSGQAGQVETALTQMVANGQLTAEGQNALRTVFQLLPITWSKLQTFLAVPAVRTTLANPLRTNAAGWLRWFAVGHAGRPPGGMADIPVNVAHRTGARVVNIDAWIIDHMREWHTFENFSFDDATIDRAPNSTFFNPGMSDADLIELITRSINHADVRASAWGDPELNADAVKLRIRNALGAWRIRQYFFSVGPPYIQISARVLHAIQALHNWR